MRIRCVDPLRCALRPLAALRLLAPTPSVPSTFHAERGVPPNNCFAVDRPTLAPGTLDH